jgi:hypothetical protein
MNNKRQLWHGFQWEADVDTLHRPHLGSWPFIRVLEIVLASAVLILTSLSAASAP